MFVIEFNFNLLINAIFTLCFIALYAPFKLLFLTILNWCIDNIPNNLFLSLIKNMYYVCMYFTYIYIINDIVCIVGNNQCN